MDTLQQQQHRKSNGNEEKKKNEAEAHFKTYFGPLNIINILFGNTQLSSARVRSLDGNIRYNG